jgi:hypothetical protein
LPEEIVDFFDLKNFTPEEKKWSSFLRPLLNSNPLNQKSAGEER